MSGQEYFIQNLESKLYRTMIKNHFSRIVFICIGSNQLEGDQFGPFVGKELTKRFETKPFIKVYGTVSEPVHFLNALEYIEKVKRENACMIGIDSAFAATEKLGNTFVSWGGIKLGKAFEKELYFPVNMSIRTVISQYQPNAIQNFQNLLQCNPKTIEQLSWHVAESIDTVIERSYYLL